MPLGINWQSRAGVPLSSTTNVPPGSDGRAPTPQQQFTNGLTTAPATTNQFQSFIGFASIPVQSTTNLNSSTNFAANVLALNWPRLTDAGGNIILIQRSAQVGAPYLGQQVSFLFGAVIPPPLTDESGVTLPLGSSLNYWLPAPYTTNSFTNAPFYWSPNAEAVFAVQAGGVDITWIKASPLVTNQPPADATNYALISGDYYRLYTVHYLVSGSAVKPPQKMYWTEASFANLGKPVDVNGEVQDVHVVYNANFPRRVAQAYVDPDQPPITDTNLLQETRSLWFDGTVQQIHAYNVEGRVFVELLGEANPDGVTRRFLGFEIVDVFKRPTPQDISVELGERLNAYQDGRDDSALNPSPINQLSSQTFYYQQVADDGRLTMYATRETRNLDDLQAYWLIAGVAGLRWPFLFDRYHEVWPTDVARYSHYVRPLVATEAEAMLTAVPLPTQNAPAIQYQDPLDQPRAKLTSTFAFYTFLSPTYPAHRALLRFISGGQVSFERVFSWLDVGIKTNSLFAGSVGANLSAWDPTNLVFNFGAEQYQAPRLISQTVNVGNRISSPPDEWNGTTYWAGYIFTNNGTSYNPGAYLNPFDVGFTNASLGAIIPINAIPTKNVLDVWWFRPDNADGSKGFLKAYWPSVVGHYTLQWPPGTKEIILASNAGSQPPLDSLQALGHIYSQNDPTLPGYNPNEEHALMLAGQAYALRDDLNVTNVSGYSSDPFVLIDYTDSDGRPNMSVYKVRREKPEAGILFDYIVEAGQNGMLQAPMPLPLLEQPIEGSGASAVNYNNAPPATSQDLPVGWSSLINTNLGHYQNFTYQDRKHNFWVYRGLHAGLPPLQAGSYNPTNNSFGSLPAATAVLNQPFAFYLHTSRRTISLTLSSSPNPPSGLGVQTTANGLVISGAPTVAGSNWLTLVVQDTGDNTYATNTLSLNVVSNGTVVAQGPLAITSTNQYSAANVTYTNRPPHLALAPTPANSFTMQFYYKTQDGFAWPGVTNPPPSGSIVPYLRPLDGFGGFTGDPTNKATASLNLVYRPVWPAVAPTLYSGDTLTKPKNGLAAVRDQNSVNVLYQQSIGQNFTNAPVSVVLHDATRQKVYQMDSLTLVNIPESVQTQSYQGRTYFPNLPPHLSQRFYFDPNLGVQGSLVLKGQFVDDPDPQSIYLMLNVLRDSDLTAVKALCPVGDTMNKTYWDTAIDNLTTFVQTFYENPVVPGQYIPNPTLTKMVGVGELAEVDNSDTAADSYSMSASGPGSGYISYIVGNGRAFTPIGAPITVYVARVSPPLNAGKLKVIPSSNPLSELETFQHTLDLAGRFGDYQYDWRIAPPINGQVPPPPYTSWTTLTNGIGAPRFTLGGSGVQVLSDNWITMRYRSVNPGANPANTNWSDWTAPQLAQGWIKRVLAGINPFNQRTSDLFNNRVNTDVSIISQAGHRWEGDIALNLDTINNPGLIEIYETVLKRGEALSINSGINYGPANDALLLAQGYLNDLYMLLGNEGWADSANPTIGISSKDNNSLAPIATALFPFKGQVASLLEQDLALLRGRDDFLSPGVTVAPVYNRLFWNYTRGIDSGEVVYALYYDILDQNNDGVVGADDAAIMFPQAHGDAYGHYLTAMKGYYSLLMNPNFDWVPRIEAVSVLGQPVSVDYLDERKFAAAAAALARTGRQVCDLTWRQGYQPGTAHGWSNLATDRVNAQRPYTVGGTTNYVTRHWGLDHWASRTGQGAYLNWVVGNAILPPVDPDPTHEGIQKVDRTTVPELQELPAVAEQLQTDMGNAEGNMTPLGISQNAIPFDISPSQILSSTHFEQVYQRAVAALGNAAVAFDDAKGVTQALRNSGDSAADFQAGVDSQEQAFTDKLVDLYGTPYPDDMGPGKTYSQDYTGPDLIHYTYVENPESTFGGALASPTNTLNFLIQTTQFPTNYWDTLYTNASFVGSSNSLVFYLGPLGFFSKPSDWSSQRASPGTVQTAISGYIKAQNALAAALDDTVTAKNSFDKAVNYFRAQQFEHEFVQNVKGQELIDSFVYKTAQLGVDIVSQLRENTKTLEANMNAALAASLPEVIVAGLASGGDLTYEADGAIQTAKAEAEAGLDAAKFAQYSVVRTLQYATEMRAAMADLGDIAPADWTIQEQKSVEDLGDKLVTLQNNLTTINQKLRDLDDAKRNYNQQVASGNRIQQERQVARQKAAAIIQGYRTRDAAFRIFRDEKLERYKTLFDLAAQYSFLAAQAYDYETGLLNTDQGRAFLNRIVSSQALGVLSGGVPQYAGSDTGDPGLSSALAEMKADWEVLRGRLGFNNPDGYGTIVSLRSENYRIVQGSDGSNNWRNVLMQGRVADLLADPDVKRYCLQIDDGSGLPVPGIVLTFGTVIADGLNLFGQPLGPADHDFSPSSFATKIFAVGVDFDGYKGMDNPTGTGSTTNDPSLDPNALAATPYVYLIPVGVDSMRSPPLGDTGTVRTWSVDDLAIPLPFNISAADFSTPGWEPSDSLSETLFSVRKHQAFRPVSTTSVFNLDVFGGGSLSRTSYTNSRLIGRSIWNSKWKLVIPGKTLLSDPSEGLNRFVRSVNDVKLYFVTYSYSGN
jgi:hypothetical protein